jgi:hypothetical protein
MDKQLLQALDNLSVALEKISETLNKKDSKSSTGKAMESGNFGGQLKEISNGVKKLLADNQKILKNQNTIMGMSKKSESDKKTGALEDVGGDKKKESSIKKGVGTILLIAVAVLAIGLAFKLVGSVDFLSVIGLALAITIISIAFEKIAKLGIPLKDALNTSYVLVIMAGAITVASWILAISVTVGIGKLISSMLIAGVLVVLSYALKKIITSLKGVNLSNVLSTAKHLPLIFFSLLGTIAIGSWILALVVPLSFSKLMTTILLAATFTILSFSLKGIMEAFKGVNVINVMKTTMYLPIIFFALLTTIAMGSWILGLVVPLSFSKLMTVILIAVAFTVLSHSLKNIMGSFKGINMANALKTTLYIPMIFLALSTAIVLSSYVLSQILPIGFAQAITAILIAVVFTVISYGLKNIMESFKGVSISSLVAAVIAIPLIFTGLSLAIMASSFLLSKVVPIKFDQALTSIVISVIFVVLAFAASLILKAISGVSIGKLITVAIIMPLLFTAMSLAITVSSYILAQAQEIPFMKLLNIMVSSIVIAIAVVVMGLAAIILNKMGGISDYIKGGIAIIIMAATIMAASLILDYGTYGKYPEWEWALGVGLSLAVFGIAAVLLGTQALNPFFYAGLGVTLLVAVTIVAASAILSLGTYDDGTYPSLSWALGVGGSIAAFGVAAVLLGFQVFNPFFYMGLGVILVVAATIVATSLVFAEGKFDEGKFPSIDWMMGAAGSILAMSLLAVAVAFLSPLIILGSIAIMMVAVSIMLVDKALSEGKFKSFPSDKWMLGATGSILAMSLLAVSISLLTPLIILGSIAIMMTALTIMLVDKAFSEGKFKSFPSDKWMLGATKSILEIAMISVGLAFFLPLIILGTISILLTAWSIKAVDDVFKSGEFKKFPSKNWIDGVSETITRWTTLMSSVSFGSVVGGAIADFFGGGLTDVAQSIVSVDNILKGGDFKSYPSKEWVDGVGASLLTMSMIMDKDLEVDDSVLGVADMMVLIAAKIKANAAAFNGTINPDFMKSIASNITSYVNLAKYVAGNYPGQSGGLVGAVQGMLFGTESTQDPMDRVVNGMIKLGDAYTKLSKSIKNFGNSINGIDAEKLSAIKSFTSNVVLMSLMDPAMFEDMLDTLEDKAGVFVDAINSIDSGKEEVKKPDSVKTGGAAKPVDPTQQKMIQLLAAMDAKLGTIAKNSSTLANYTNELRTSSGIKAKK